MQAGGDHTADEPREKCGVVGVSLADREAARPLYYALYALQHRGQESAGIVTHDGFQQHSHVERGLVGDAFDEGDLESLSGGTGIGHVRYPTAGSLDKSCAQPFSVSFKSGSLGLAQREPRERRRGARGARGGRPRVHVRRRHRGDRPRPRAQPPRRGPRAGGQNTR